MVALESKYRDAGLSVMCFPSRDFRQELKNNEDIASFVAKFGADHGLIMMDQIQLNGDGQAPAWGWLKSQSGNLDDVGWNFRTKFLVARDGEQVERFERVDPNDLEDRIKELLKVGSKAGL
jgi:glutathione peroxidase